MYVYCKRVFRIYVFATFTGVRGCKISHPGTGKTALLLLLGEEVTTAGSGNRIVQQWLTPVAIKVTFNWARGAAPIVVNNLAVAVSWEIMQHCRPIDQECQERVYVKRQISPIKVLKIGHMFKKKTPYFLRTKRT